MSQRSSRRVLLFALAISLLVHLIVLAWLRFPFAANAPQRPAVVRTQLATIAHLVRARRTPPPRVLARPQRSVTRKRVSSIVPLKSHGSPGAHAIAPPVAPSPTPAVTPAGTCGDPNAKAALASPPPPPELSADLRAQAGSGTTTVRVDIGVDGGATGAAIVGTSGNHDLDLVAVSMAQAARYAPALQKCKPIAGTYDFTVKFVAW